MPTVHEKNITVICEDEGISHADPNPAFKRPDYKLLFVRAMKLADKYAGTKKKQWHEGCTNADYVEYMKLKELEP